MFVFLPGSVFSFKLFFKIELYWAFSVAYKKNKTTTFAQMILICHHRSMIWKLMIKHCACPYITYSHPLPPLTERVDCVAMAIRVFSLCENWRRGRTVVSLCRLAASHLSLILNHTDYLWSHFRDWRGFQMLVINNNKLSSITVHYINMCSFI